MKTRIQNQIGSTALVLLAGGALLLAAGCASTKAPTSAATPARLPGPRRPRGPRGPPGQGQPVFASDTAAMDAILAAVKAEDHEQVHHILGPAWKELVSGDKVEDANAFHEFARRAAERAVLQKQDDSTSIIHVGKEDWPFPIPVAKSPEGKWFFDTEAGKTEVLARRIGANELETIELCRAYVVAQKQYASRDRDGSGVLKFAQRILSTPGKMDGLYWPAAAGQEASPFGDLFAAASKEGYEQTEGHPRQPYHGYHFRVLKGQGPAAPGGKLSYVANGNMTAGFALVAFPVDYESSGIMTFIVNQQGAVYQKDLGPDTVKLAAHDGVQP